MRGSLATAESGRRPLEARRLAIGRAGSRACGNGIEVRLLLEPDGTIAELGVSARGHQLPGDPSALVAWFVGMSTTQALAVTHREISERLGGLPESKMYCSVLLHEALRAAVSQDDQHDAGERSGVTCRCFTVAEDLIRRAVRGNGLTSLEQVAGYTCAGAGCGLCAEGIASILSSVSHEAQCRRGHDSLTHVALANTSVPANGA